MSLLSILFGCNNKKTAPNVQEWPRFPITNKPELTVKPIHLADGFILMSFYIAPDKQNIYVLGARIPKKDRDNETSENQPGGPEYTDYRLLCLDTNGQTKYYKDMLHKDWTYGGTLGLLEGELLLRIGDWFLVLEPMTFAIKEKIPVHDSYYIPWKNTVFTRDEFLSDYKSKLDAVLKNCKNCKFLYWSPGSEYLVFVQGAVGKRSAWTPMSYEENELSELKHRFESISVTLNPKVVNGDGTTHFEIVDDEVQIKEVEYLSAGTQLVYPNYKSRSVLQYELNMKGQKVNFSTTDRDGHNLHLHFSNNLMLTLLDGSIWVVYEDILYRIHKN